MKYNFDEIIERRNTDCVKWDGAVNVWGKKDLIPMWVADMDFRTPDFVTDVIKNTLKNDVLGYTFACDDWHESICKWLWKKHQWHVTREMLTFVPGIVRGQALALLCFTQKGDKVMVMPPVYHPFFLVTEKLGREVVYSPLEIRDDEMYIDFERLEHDMEGCKALILCNPHNPGGRVWTLEELQRIAEIAERHGTLVISDEIHADLTLPPYKHHPFSTVSDAAARNSIVFMSPSKAFNMPGLSSSYAVAVDGDIYRRFNEFMEAGAFSEGHIFAYQTVAAAYMKGEEWLSQCLEYIGDNIRYVKNFLQENLSQIGMIEPQASFLVFLDCRGLNMSQQELKSFFADKAKLALNDGTMFGKQGEGFMRMNVACPRELLHKALRQLQQAVENLDK